MPIGPAAPPRTELEDTASLIPYALSRDDRGQDGHRVPDEVLHEAEETEQRRIVTVLFADLTSSTALAEDMDPEDTRALLGGFFDTMAREIHRHGGTVEKYIGDAVMAVFGLPVAHEDDPVRAVRAALDMQIALRRFNADRSWKILPRPNYRCVSASTVVTLPPRVAPSKAAISCDWRRD